MTAQVLVLGPARVRVPVPGQVEAFPAGRSQARRVTGINKYSEIGIVSAVKMESRIQ